MVSRDNLKKALARVKLHNAETVERRAALHSETARASAPFPPPARASSADRVYLASFCQTMW
jgi:hypothetical protein